MLQVAVKERERVRGQSQLQVYVLGISFSIHALFFPGKSEKEKKGSKKEEKRTRQWQLSNSEDGHKTPTTTIFIGVFTIFYWPPGCKILPRSQHFNLPQ